jgi:hypothetical protein
VKIKSFSLWLGLVIIGMPISSALAGQLSLIAQHVVTMSVTNQATGEILNFSNGSVGIYTMGGAHDPMENSTVPTGVYQTLIYGTPLATVYSNPIMTSLQTLTNAVSFDGNNKFTMAVTLIGNAPNIQLLPGGRFPGQIHEEANLIPLQFIYTIPVDGSYSCQIKDNYNLQYQLQQYLGGSNRFYYTFGMVSIQAGVSTSESPLPITGSKVPINDRQGVGNSTKPLSNFNLHPAAEEEIFSIIVNDLKAGDKIFLHCILDNTIEGLSYNTRCTISPIMHLLDATPIIPEP